MMSKDFDDKEEIMSDEILDGQWTTGPLSEARKNLNTFCANMLLQQSLRLMVEEITMLEDIIADDSTSIVEKVSAQQTLAILQTTWVSLTDQFGVRA